MTEAPKPAAAHAPGTRIAGRYTIISKLGSGASGHVYLAQDETTDDKLALKLLHPHLVSDPQIRGRFHREASILQRLEGEHVVRLYDSGEAEDGSLFMALEHSEGEGLDRLIAREAPLAQKRAILLALQIGKALVQAHSAGVVHRDLKPGNVLIETTRQVDERVRVLDFGLAKVLEGAMESLTALSEQHMVFGTPEYMAPEQARGDEADPRADLYALGIILYELLTGEVPFSTSSPIATMTAHLASMPAPPSARCKAGAISPAADAVVLHALAKAPEDRYPNAAAMNEALESALAHPTHVDSTRPKAAEPAPAVDELALRDTLLSVHTTQALTTMPRLVPTQERSSSGWRWAVLGILLAAAVGLLLSSL